MQFAATDSICLQLQAPEAAAGPMSDCAPLAEALKMNGLSQLAGLLAAPVRSTPALSLPVFTPPADTSAVQAKTTLSQPFTGLKSVSGC